MDTISNRYRRSGLIWVALLLLLTMWPGTWPVGSAPAGAHAQPATTTLDPEVAARALVFAAAPPVAASVPRAAPTLSATNIYTAYLPLVMMRPVDENVPGAPIIASFSASPASIKPGESSTLNWSVSAATSLSIEPNVGPVSGISVVVRPTTTTEYILTATNAAGTSTAKVTVVVTGSGNDADNGHLFTRSSTNVEDTSLAIDRAGGLHIAYSPYGGSTNNTPSYPVQYLYCAVSCANLASWTATEIGNAGSLGGTARLALDPQGHPRILWFQLNSFFDAVGHYIYASCDAQCTSVASWTVVTLPMSESIGPSEGRYFTLDPQGRPRFFYTDTAFNRIGTYYAFCDSGCTSAASWHEGKLADTSLLFAFSPAYDTAGGLHMAYSDATGPTTRVAYLECAAACDVGTNWSWTVLPAAIGTLGLGDDFTLQLDSQGRPRLALFPGFFSSGPPSHLLYYAWCDSACTTDTSWSRQGVGLPEHYGGSVDLAIDSQNRPRMAYRVDAISQSIDGVGYAWCTSSCETSSPTWQSMIVEESKEIDRTSPIPPKSGCSISTWMLAQGALSLGMDTAGNPRISYIAKHLQGGTCSAETDLLQPRLALFKQL